MIREPLTLAAILAAITALAFWLDRRFVWAERVGATLLVILFGAILSNLGLVPAASPVYDAITGPLTSLAIVWLLLAVDLRDLRAAGPRMIGAFGLAVLATSVGAITATLLFAGTFGDDAWRLAGALTGTYSGGSLNFVAVGRALEMPDALFAATTAADNVMTALWLGATLTLPVWLARYYPAPAAGTAGPAHVSAPTSPAGTAPPAADAAAPADSRTPATAAGRGGRATDGGARATDGGARTTDGGRPEHPFFAAVPLRLLDVSLLIAAGLLLLRAAGWTAARVPGIPEVLWLTTFALVAGQLPPVRRLAGAMQLGSLALHFFFAIIGIGSRLGEIARVGPEVFYIVALVVLIHGTLTFGLARVVRLDIGATAVASQAAVGGPSTALALAVARDWRALVLPGAVAGLLGYAVGNYAGFGVAYLVRSLIGG